MTPPWPPTHLLPTIADGPSPALARHGFTVVRPGRAPVLVLAADDRELWLDGRQIAAFGRSRVLWTLFATIAGSPGGTREALFQAVWNEPYRPPSSDDKLHMAVVRVRKRLGDAPIGLEPEPAGGYALTGVGAVLRFERAAVQALPTTTVAAPTVAVRGRTADIDAVGRGLARGPVCVTGPPGVGKSLVAHAVAADGAGWRVELADAPDRDAVLRAMGRALDVPLGNDAVTQVGAVLAQHGDAVVWLDHVDPAADDVAALVDDWRRAAPATRWLATGARPLPGWTAVTLAPLDRSSGAALYADRVRERVPGWVPDAEPVGALVDALGGLPLAIELAAARAPVLTASGVLAQLDRAGLRVLARPRDRSRHGSLRQAVTWSLDLLDDTHRGALAQCAVFRDGFTPEAAGEVVALGPDAWLIDVLDALCAWSLVIPDAGRPGRLRVPGPVAAVARETLLEEDRRALRARHAAWFARYGTTDTVGTGPGDATALVAESANLDLAAEAADPEHAACAGIAAMRAAVLVGPIARAVRIGQRLLGRDDLTPTTAARVAIALYLAHRQAGELDAAHAALDWAERRTGDDRTRATVLVYRAELLRVQGRGAEAEPLLDEAAALVPPGDPTGVGRTRRLVWALLRRFTDPSAACAVLSELAAAYRRLGDARQEAQVQLSLGAIHLEQGRVPAARQALDHALGRATVAGDVRLEGLIRSALGAAAGTDGRLDAARAHFEAAMTIHRRLGARRSEGIVAGNLAELFMRAGRPADALGQLDFAVDRAAEVGDRATWSQFLAARGEARVQLGDAEGGWRDLDDALATLGPGDAERPGVVARRERAASWAAPA